MTEEIAWLESSRGYIKEDLKCIASNFIKLGFHLWEVQRNEYYREDGYESVHEFAEAEFGIKKSTCYNYIALMQKFSRDGQTVFLDDKWQGYNCSQLVEMLSMEKDMLSRIRPDYTIAQIREIKKYGKLVDEAEMAEDMRILYDWIKTDMRLGDEKIHRDIADVCIINECNSYSGGSGYTGFDYLFTPGYIKINSYRYCSRKVLLDCMDKYVGFKTAAVPMAEEVMAEEAVAEKAVQNNSETYELRKNSEAYELNHETPLADALMEILIGNIKNVDKVAALVDFIDREIKYCMWN